MTAEATAQATERHDEKLRFRIINDIELAELPPLSWLIEDIMPAGGLAVLFGGPGTGKTFVALDLALSIATERDWFGRAVLRGPVVYVAAEGSGGFRARVGAWKKARSIERSTDCGFIVEAVQLRQPRYRNALIEALEELPKAPVLVVIDTMARCFVGGDENSFQDVSVFVAAADFIRKRTGAAVLIVHHTPKNKSGTARGSSALEGAADTMLKLEKKAKAITLKCSKQKDAAPFDPIHLRLVQVELADGEVSCVVGTGEATLAGSQVKALDALQSFGEEGATASEWEAQFTSTTQKSSATFYRVLGALETDGYVTRPGNSDKGERYGLTARGTEALTIS